MNKVSFRMATISVAILFIGCKTDSVHIPKEINSAVVQERSAIIHKVPSTLVHLRDSVIGMRLTPHDYMIYNYYTGEEVNQIRMDTLAFPRLISMARKAEGKDYQFHPASELAKDGISPFEIYNLCLDDEDPEKLWLFFAVRAILSDSIEHGGDLVPATVFSSLQFIGELDNTEFKIKKYYYIYTGTEVFPYAIHGALKVKDSFFTRNIPTIIDNQVVSIKRANDSLYTLNRLLLPGEGTAKYMKTKLVTELRFDRTADNRMLIANSFHLYDDQEKQIFEVNNEETNRNIKNFKHLGRDGIIYYVSEKQNELRSNQLYRYHPEHGKQLLFEFENWGPAVIIPEKNEIVRLVKADTVCYFYTYKLL